MIVHFLLKKNDHLGLESLIVIIVQTSMSNHTLLINIAKIFVHFLESIYHLLTVLITIKYVNLGP